jgi:hypothetical protein
VINPEEEEGLGLEERGKEKRQRRTTRPRPPESDLFDNEAPEADEGR